MRNTCRDDVDLNCGNPYNIAVEMQIHLTIEDEERFVEGVVFVGVWASIHSKYLDVRSCCLADDSGVPSDRKGGGDSQQIGFANWPS